MRMGSKPPQSPAILALIVMSNAKERLLKIEDVLSVEEQSVSKIGGNRQNGGSTAFSKKRQNRKGRESR